jgi:hypothetical protein
LRVLLLSATAAAVAATQLPALCIIPWLTTRPYSGD